MKFFLVRNDRGEPRAPGGLCFASKRRKTPPPWPSPTLRATPSIRRHGLRILQRIRRRHPAPKGDSRRRERRVLPRDDEARRERLPRWQQRPIRPADGRVGLPSPLRRAGAVSRDALRRRRRRSVLGPERASHGRGRRTRMHGAAAGTADRVVRRIILVDPSTPSVGSASPARARASRTTRTSARSRTPATSSTPPPAIESARSTTSPRTARIHKPAFGSPGPTCLASTKPWTDRR